MGQPVFLFKSQGISDGVKVTLQRIREKDLKDWLQNLGILPKFKATIEIDGKEYEVEQKRVQTLEFHYYANGQEVTERKREFRWWKIVKEEKSPASLKRSDVIHAEKELPFHKVMKNCIASAGYFMSAWHGSKEEPHFYAERVKMLRQEAERFNKPTKDNPAGIVGIGPFTWGAIMGEPLPPQFSIAYPIIISELEVVWLVLMASVAIEPKKEEFPYANAVMSLDIPIVEEKTEELPPDTVQVEQLISV